MRSMYLQQAFGQANEAIERLHKLTDFSQLAITTTPKAIKTFDFQFNNVSFSYPGATDNSLNGVNFIVPQEKTVALVGSS